MVVGRVAVPGRVVANGAPGVGGAQQQQLVVMPQSAGLAGDGGGLALGADWRRRPDRRPAAQTRPLLAYAGVDCSDFDVPWCLSFALPRLSRPRLSYSGRRLGCMSQCLFGRASSSIIGRCSRVSRPLQQLQQEQTPPQAGVHNVINQIHDILALLFSHQHDPLSRACNRSRLS